MLGVQHCAGTAVVSLINLLYVPEIVESTVGVPPPPPALAPPAGEPVTTPAPSPQVFSPLFLPNHIDNTTAINDPKLDKELDNLSAVLR